MLEALFGNANIQKILLFLFVNNKCYGAQLQRLLKTPLTSLQNAFARLEKGRIIQSYCEGKTKLYQLNPSHPLLSELEQLLKRAYSLLPPQEKKLFSLVQHDSLERRIQEPLLMAFWQRLQTLKEFTRVIHSRSSEESAWTRKGKGDVSVVPLSDTVLELQERGSWELQQGGTISFNNGFRWTLDKSACMLSLEHLRLGANHADFLFHLAPMNKNLLASVESHLYEENAYHATASWDLHAIRLNWRAIGPHKNEEIESHYL